MIGGANLRLQKYFRGQVLQPLNQIILPLLHPFREYSFLFASLSGSDRGQSLVDLSLSYLALLNLELCVFCATQSKISDERGRQSEILNEASHETYLF